jgi:hypothetical protein
MADWKHRTLMTLDVLACVGLVLIGIQFASRPTRKPAPIRVRPAMDLRRVIVPPNVVRVAEHSSERIEVVTDEWILQLHAIDPDGAQNMLQSNRSMVQNPKTSRENVLQVPGSPAVHRFLFGVEGPSRAGQVHYVVSFGDGLGWAYGWGAPRDVRVPFDTKPFDAVLLALRLADKPLLEQEVPPAWITYQSKRTAGSAIAKFVVDTEAPVRIGRDDAMDRDGSQFNDDEYNRGGRQMAPDLIEFYTKTDLASVRLDVWLDTPPTRPHEPIFEATLRLDTGKIWVHAFDERFYAPVPPGHYDVSIRRVNAGKDSSEMLTDDEYFQRNDLERYEVILKHRSPER